MCDFVVTEHLGFFTCIIPRLDCWRMADWRSKGFSSFSEYVQSFESDEYEPAYAAASANEAMDVDYRTPESEAAPNIAPTQEQQNRLDIGMHVGKSVPEDLKKELLRNPWIPPPTYSFPAEMIGSQNRYFNPAWLHQFEWLVWSELLTGGLCKYCVLFAPENVRNQKLQAFVTTSFKKYKKATGKDGLLHAHEEAGYHKFAVERAHAFLKRVEGIKPRQ